MFKIVSPAEAAKSDAVICIRVADARWIAKDSKQEKCMACAEPVWVAPSSPVAPPKVCSRCAVGMLGNKH